MRLLLSTLLRQEPGLSRTSVAFEEPEVHLSHQETDQAVLLVEEVGVTTAMEFPALDCLRRFLDRRASLPLTPSAPGDVHA